MQFILISQHYIVPSSTPPSTMKEDICNEIALQKQKRILIPLTNYDNKMYSWVFIFYFLFFIIICFQVTYLLCC